MEIFQTKSSYFFTRIDIIPRGIVTKRSGSVPYPKTLICALQLFEDKHTPRLNLKTRLFQPPTNSFAFLGGSRIFLKNFVPVFPKKKMTMD
jgi:hypothetical protein